MLSGGDDDIDPAGKDLHPDNVQCWKELGGATENETESYVVL